MKHRSLFIVVCLLAGCTSRQVEVPAAVKQAFATRFPSAKEVKWTSESLKEYEAEFETGKVDQSASFDPAGNWLETETEIKVSEIPGVVSETMAREFAGYTVGEAEQVDTPQQSGLYEIELKKGKEVKEVLFSADGRVKKAE